MKKNNKSKNVMLMVPKRRESIKWEKEGDIITLIIERDKFLDNVMHKVFKTPKSIRIELDSIGSFVWENCDGIDTINNISKKMENHFGSKAEPVIERLVTYIRTLKNNKFIEVE